MLSERSIVWFRQDLRLSDNPAINKAVESGSILPVYIFDDCSPEQFKIGGASKIWLYRSLESLNESLCGKLNIYMGNSKEIISNLIEKYDIQNVFCNICYEPWHLEQESKIKNLCEAKSINYESFNSNYLWGVNDILKDDGSYYKVFTAYKKKSYSLNPRKAVKQHKKINAIKDKNNSTLLSDLDLLPRDKVWHKKILDSWEIGELAAQNKLDSFIKEKLAGYKDGRNYPMKEQTSFLSPHLHFGEISSAQIWESINNFGNIYANDSDIEHFLSEIIWREFSCYLLHHFKSLHIKNFNSKFDNFPWQDNIKYLKAWQSGNTGYPIVDAGMRQLWQTGYMHNRVRMIVASFLVKNLNIHWHKGQDWFWDCLVDADLANNSASWQWVSGSGADAAPYFRIFNPVTQGEKFDSEGDYIRKFVPELKRLSNKYLFNPSTAPQHILESAGVVLGQSYSEPIVNLTDSRNHALNAYKGL
ncbi:MAG TPA: deoxyribodipyrimidine photo-lyase [Candidatus Megaira endosymbiont of Nemacystus decipiens]|nr:deoxyribodipyrimidine photo-lyase [Candidatus Megaera endosymbiont of Nemacystus decipiens]